MTQYIKLLLKYLVLFIIGGTIYVGIELLWRGYSHISMFILAGLVFIAWGLLNELFSWKLSFIIQMIICSVIATIGEFITGVVVNLIMDLHVWDYSNLPCNILGQICLPFSLIWLALSPIGIILDDWIRFRFFNEDKPHYRL